MTQILLAAQLVVFIAAVVLAVKAGGRFLSATTDNREAQARALVAAVEQSKAAAGELRTERERVAAHVAPSLVAQTVVIQTRDDQTIRGVLVAEHVDRLYLEQAVYVESPKQQSSIGGLTIVPRANVAWMQIPPATATESAAQGA